MRCDELRQAEFLLVARGCHTLSGRRGRAQAVATHAGRIVAVGSRRGLRDLVGPGTRVVDLGYAVLTPGLVDCHAHFFAWALERALVIDVANLPTLEATLAHIRRQAAQKKIGRWVVAAGFDHNVWGTGFPTAADLDEAVRDGPALVRSRDGHTVWLNTRGLEAAGIGRGSGGPALVRCLRDAQGRPTGIVQEAWTELPDPLRDFVACQDTRTLRTIDGALAEAYAQAWSLGIVGVHSMDEAPSLFHLQRQRQEGRLGLRVVHAIPVASLDQAAALGLRSGVGDDWLRIGAVKIFADGALGSQTAYMFDTYPDRPGYHGVPVLVGAELTETVVKAARCGWAVWIHAIGDQAVHDAVAAIAAARQAEVTPLPHRIEHAQCVRPTDADRMAGLRITASVQPCHLIADIVTAERHWPRARQNAYPFRRLLDAGVSLAAGSDVPVESLDPRRSFYAATCRTDAHGAPAGGWFAEQRITAEDVLRAFTVGAVRSVGQPPPAGTLAPGAPADLTIWGADPLAVPPAELREIPIIGVVIGGRLHLK